MNPHHPIYIPSKGRWDNQMTSRYLNAMGVPHFIIVEEQELDRYKAKAAPLATFLLLPVDEYRAKHETCDDLGATRSYGAGPARNFAWDHAVASGATWHWDIDDNIRGFYRLNHNLKTPVADGTILRVMEAFVERYENIAEAGPNYFMFAPRKSQIPPFVPNTRIYSCSLIRNDIPFRWRGRLNEDTDLSLRILKAGWCTVQFNAFLQDKMTTQTMKGGYNSEFYAREGTLPKSEFLVRMHPDIARIAWRFGRWHHYVDYSGFRFRKLVRRADAAIPAGTDNWGMILEQQIGNRWVEVTRPDVIPAELLLPQTQRDAESDALVAAATTPAIDWLPDPTFTGQMTFDAAW